MSQDTIAADKRQGCQQNDSPLATFQDNSVPRSPLDELVQEGARRMLQAAIDAEVDEFLALHSTRVDSQGRRQVVRNGNLPSREILSGAGPLEVKQPRVRDKSADKKNRVSFSPNILPPYLKRTSNIEDLIPWLYLKGLSSGDFSEALQSLLGEQAKGLSANMIVRLKEKWSQEYEAWSKRDLTGKQYAYVWADGIHVNVRLEDEANKRQCMLVIMGATASGEKEIIAIQDGYRESTQSWYELLLNVQKRGLEIDPKLAIGDGALGFWAALRKVFPETKEQRCWFHKSGNILDRMPNSVQPKAKMDIQEIWKSPTKKEALKAIDHFAEKYGAKYEKACKCLMKDRDVLLTLYDFLAEHWAHLRTTNPIESTFATIRLRHRRTKGSGSRRASLAMIFKLAESASKKWRRLRGYEKLSLVIEGKTFKDGTLQEQKAA